MTAIGTTLAAPGTVGASAPTTRRRIATVVDVDVPLTRRALEVLLHLAVNRSAVMRQYGDADPAEASAVEEAIRSLRRASGGGA